MNDHYAKEAARLLADDTFRSALSTVYNNAVEALVTVDAADPVKVLRLQAKAQVVEEVLAELSAAIHAMPADTPVP